MANIMERITAIRDFFLKKLLNYNKILDRPLDH